MPRTLDSSLLEGTFVIQYDDGAYNYGPSHSPANGFPTTLSEASVYASREAAEDKARDLRNPDGSGAVILPLAAAQELEAARAA